MAYNNGFQMPYGNGMVGNYQQYQQYQQPPQEQQIQQIRQVQPVQQQQNPIWVQGISGANNVYVPPNTIVPLWDSDVPVIYWKSTDASGRPNIKILDYTVRNQQQDNDLPVSKPEAVETNYATKEDIESIRKDLNRCISRMNSMDNKKERKE